MHCSSGGMKGSLPQVEIPPPDPREAMFALTSYAELLTKSPQKRDINKAINLEYGTDKLKKKDVNIGMLVCLGCLKSA